MFKKLLPRVITGVAVLVVVLALVWAPSLHIGFNVLVTLFAAVGLFEYFRLTIYRETADDGITAVIFGSIVTATGYAAQPWLTLLTLLAISIPIATQLVLEEEPTFRRVVSGVVGMIYIGWFGAHLLFLHNDPNMGPGMVTLLLVAVILTDTGAYFVGSMIGKRKLAPKLSPSKTWEGSIGGLIVATIGMGAVFGLNQSVMAGQFPDWPVSAYLIAGALLSVAGQVGDLVESALKRNAGVKDSGNVFPGHGGMLDRCDSIVFAAPVLYYIAVLLPRVL